jgi:hypothetical protein
MGLGEPLGIAEITQISGPVWDDGFVVTGILTPNSHGHGTEARHFHLALNA